MNDEYITMSQKEIKCYDIIKKLINKEINGSEASNILKMTKRHIRRIKKRVKEEGIKGLIHKNRGKQSNRKMPEEEAGKIAELIRTFYQGFSPTFATEKLEEKHNIKRDPKTTRSIMIANNLWKPKQKKKEKHREWRQRKASCGEMIQYDGSYEYWFEERGKKQCLLASIDDATSVVNAIFDEHEGVFPTFNFWREYIREKGKPYSIYVDKFSTYSMNHKLAKENCDTLTQFQRAMEELNIEVITAHSSQAKGRVERLFKTLQDRLIKELRLNSISTIKEANEFLKQEFLPKFNAKFSVEARTKANLHKKLTGEEESKIDAIFSRQNKRTVRSDFTISHKNNWYQLKKDQPATIQKRDAIIVEERMDNAIKLRLRGKYLNYEILPERPKKATKDKMWVIARTKSHKPPKDHPWRKRILFKKQKAYLKLKAH